MKSLPKWVVPFFLVTTIGTIIMVTSKFAQKTDVYASGRVILSKDLTNYAQGIETLFIIIFEDGGPPMPYAALRAKMGKKLEGEIYHFTLTPSNLQIMNPNRPKPKKLRIKARLDRNGQAGPNQPGDIVGEVSGVDYGQYGITIHLNQGIR